MPLRWEVLVLFGCALFGIVLVLRRAIVRGRSNEAVRISLSHFGVAAAGGLLVSLGLAGVVFWVLNVLPRVLPYRPFVVGGTFVAVAAGTLAVARTFRGHTVFRLAGGARAVPWTLAALLGASFIGLTAKSFTLPVRRGSRYVISEELIRFGALACGVIFLLGVLSALLPWVLDRLERRSFVSFVGARHVRAHKSGFLTVISVLSICGVAVSSCALCSVVSIMGGFGQDLKRKILGNNAHVTVDYAAQLTGFEDWEPMLDRVRQVPGVAAATPVVAGEAMASSNANTAGCLVRGIDPGTIGDVIDLVKNIEYGKLDYLIDEAKLSNLPPDEIIGGGISGEPYRKGPDLSTLFGTGLDPSVRAALRATTPYPGIIIGRELARTLHLMVGDEFTLVSPLGDLGPMGVLPRARKFRVAAIFYSGMYEYDATHVYLRLDVAQKFFSLEDKVTAVEIRAVEAENTESLVAPVKAAVEKDDLRVRDWREMNKNLFSALKLERIATFIILSIAIAVASFCIICTLLLMVTEKGKEIAIMKALGASDTSILSIFMTEGMIIGGIGTVFGVATGVAVCVGLKWFGVRLDPDVYYIDRLPVATNAGDYATVAIAALLICSIATIYPAKAASALRPVDGLRYE
jgi:lipoprotein-releasing system permease protein